MVGSVGLRSTEIAHLSLVSFSRGGYWLVNVATEKAGVVVGVGALAMVVGLWE